MVDGGTLMLKDWVRESTPGYMLGYLSDRLITGERVRFPTESELRSLVQRSFGGRAIRAQFRVRPWHCNLVLVISRCT
jgi:2-polyprenyl-6-hydroxyphenyl methylase/3-demethylubiquinone-9 3-methyltransferase